MNIAFKINYIQMLLTDGMIPQEEILHLFEKEINEQLRLQFNNDLKVLLNEKD